MQLIRTAALFGFLITSPTYAAGFAHNANFVVFTPAAPTKEAGQRLAEQVLQQAERYRSEIAKEWLGEALPARSGRTVVNVDLSDTQDRGLTWAKDHSDRTFHNIYLTTSAEKALGCTLHHEIVHAVLATRYPHPHRLPTWLEEGIASRYDDAATVAARRRTTRAWGRFVQVPRLTRLLNSQQMPSHDDTSYAAATSLVSFLLAHGDRQTLLQFGAAGETLGWDAALRTHYRIDGARQLQAEWERWLQTSDAIANRVPQQTQLGRLRRAQSSRSLALPISSARLPLPKIRG